MNPIVVLSLFDGISCGRVALERAHIPVSKYYASEINKYAIQITQKNYPDTIQLGDVKNVWARNLLKIDLLIGGSPCQDLSITQSKTRKGLRGSKSILFWHYVRLLKTCKPKWFLLENVESMRREDKETITSILGVEPIMINSSSVSAQERKRLYWTNIEGVESLSENEIVLKDIMEKNVKEKYFYNYPLSAIDSSKQICATMFFNIHDMHKRIFNPNFKVHALTSCGGGNTQKKVLDGERARKLTPIEYERLQTLPDNYTQGISDSQRYNCIGNAWTVDVIAHIFKSILE